MLLVSYAKGPEMNSIGFKRTRSILPSLPNTSSHIIRKTEMPCHIQKELFDYPIDNHLGSFGVVQKIIPGRK